MSHPAGHLSGREPVAERSFTVPQMKQTPPAVQTVELYSTTCSSKVW